MISVKDHRELQAVVLALKAADKDLRNDINRATRAELADLWKSLVQVHATYTLESRVLAKGAGIRAGNPPAAVAATSRRRLSGGLTPAGQWYAVEFGADQSTKRTYQRRSPKGRTHTVTRHTTHQLPPRLRKGYVVHQAFAEFAPRAASLWVQLVIKKYADAAEAARKG